MAVYLSITWPRIVFRPQSWLAALITFIFHLQAPVSDEDEDTFYDSETVPLPLSAGQLASPASSCCPSDLESVQGDSEAEEVWGGRTPTRESIYYNPSMSEGEVTPTR